MLIDRYFEAIRSVVDTVLQKERENIQKAGELIAAACENGHKMYVDGVVHGIEGDIIGRGGGPAFVQKYYADKTELKAGDVLIVSSVSGRTKAVVERAWDAIEKGVTVIALTSMSYASTVDAVHESGKKLHEFVTIAIDNCAPPAEAMLEVDGIEARFGAASGISSAHILWGIVCCAVEKMMQDGCTPAVFKSANFPGGNDYNNEYVYPHYEQYGW